MVVADDLGVLRGPVSGVVVLPLHLDASARSAYDLTDPVRLRLLYEMVLAGASGVADLSQWLRHEC